MSYSELYIPEQAQRRTEGMVHFKKLLGRSLVSNNEAF